MVRKDGLEVEGTTADPPPQGDDSALVSGPRKGARMSMWQEKLVDVATRGEHDAQRSVLRMYSYA
jgi:hypothetical protein